MNKFDASYLTETEEEQLQMTLPLLIAPTTKPLNEFRQIEIAMENLRLIRSLFERKFVNSSYLNVMLREKLENDNISHRGEIDRLTRILTSTNSNHMNNLNEAELEKKRTEEKYAKLIKFLSEMGKLINSVNRDILQESRDNNNNESNNSDALGDHAANDGNAQGAQIQDSVDLCSETEEVERNDDLLVDAEQSATVHTAGVAHEKVENSEVEAMNYSQETEIDRNETGVQTEDVVETGCESSEEICNTNENAPETKKFVCNKCTNSYTKRRSLIRHKVLEHGMKRKKSIVKPKDAKTAKLLKNSPLKSIAMAQTSAYGVPRPRSRLQSKTKSSSSEMFCYKLVASDETNDASGSGGDFVKRKPSYRNSITFNPISNKYQKTVLVLSPEFVRREKRYP